jgi:hypothetical protein
MITAEQIPEAVAHAAESAWSKDATWKEVVAAVLNACDVVALVRKETLEEAAKLVEERTLRNRKIYALQNGMRDYVRRCEHAAAIRKLGGE